MNPANAWLLLTTRSPGVGFLPGGWGSIRPSDVALALQGLPRPQFLLGMACFAGDKDCMHELVTLVKLEIVLPAAELDNWKIKRGSETYRRLSALAVFECVNKDPLAQGMRCFVCQGKGTYNPTSSDPKETAEERNRLKRSLRRLKRLEWRAGLLTKEIASAGKDADRSKVKRLKTVLRWSRQLAQFTETLSTPARCISCRGTGRISLSAMHRAWLTGFSTDHWLRTWSARYEPIRYTLDGWLSDCLTQVRQKFDGPSLTDMPVQMV